VKTRGQSLTVLLEKQRNFAVKNVVIFLDIVMKHHLVQIYLHIVDQIRKKRQKKNKNENFAEYTKRGNMVTAWFKESRNKFQSTLGGKKL
jgi:hypothetical protein